MSNPMLQALNKRSQASQQQKANNPFQMIQEFAKFKKQMQGKNPQAIVEDLLKSGKMSQAQFEELKQEANALQSILK